MPISLSRFSLIALSCLGATSVLAAQTPSGACAPVTAAILKQAATPHHTFLTKTSNGATETSESIATSDAIYIILRGQWRRSPLTPQAMLDQKRENIRAAKSFTCQPVREEAVNGTAATLYHVKTVSEAAGTSEAQTWIATSSGLRIKEEIDNDLGDGVPKMHMSTRYEYGNVQAPPGVK